MTPKLTDQDILDERFMDQALTQARRALGLTSPNPPVGAVVVKDQQVLGSGYHQQAGGSHAEIYALAAAREAHGKRVRGATIYVTLEPCSTQGRTPPCTSALIEAGIKRVVYGAADPNPAHAGGADALLKAAGIEVRSGVCRQDCEQLIRPFAKWITTGLPYVIVKVGQTLDGRITLPPGESQWITSESARAHARRLRLRVDAILVGAETVRRDNPRLTLRDRGPIASQKEQPWRVILTHSGQLPIDSHLFTDDFRHRTLILQGYPFAEVMQQLAQRQITSVLIEGGGRVITQAFRHQMVDEAHWYLAPRFSGGGQLSIGDPPLMASVPMADVSILPIGSNVLVSGTPVWPENPEPKPA
jgi:diaminohydroxyphosphoribosylaminopyrimidine deaminase/5-amino-6-(5-phosphoribosylamino)uracil reductase